MRRASAGVLAVVIALSALAVVGTAGRATSSDAMSVTDVAMSFVRGDAAAFGLTASDVGDLAVSSVVHDRDSGVTYVYLQQRYGGIDVEGAILNVNLRPDGSVLSAGSSFASGLEAAADMQAARVPAVDATTLAAQALDLVPTTSFQVLTPPSGTDQAGTITASGVALEPIGAALVWFPVETTIRLAWRLEIQEVGGDHWWNAYVDATTGAFLGKYDLVAHDSAAAIASAVGHPDTEPPTPLPPFAPTDGATYRVYPIPYESPSDGDRVLAENAADPAASPYGWHDLNGAPGAESTLTTGNNVDAYADRDANNVPDPGSRPDGGPSLAFDFPIDFTQEPITYQPAAITNLFYWNNIMHDVSYEYGFDEEAGNFQANNYGHGGLGNDYVRAEGQDGSGLNNANFATGVDGVRPRMQMFQWHLSLPTLVTVLPPSPIAGTYDAVDAAFGPLLKDTGPITAEVAYVGRGCPADSISPGSPEDPYLADPAGKIAMIDRGACTFVSKVSRAQSAGALAVIMVNNVPGPAITMGGTDPTIVIPSVMITLSDGDLLKANLPFVAKMEANPGMRPDRDADLDAGVISHEYTHGISNRLTGGPATVSCLNNAEQMGEGWSDYMALVLTTRPSDTPTTPRGVGTYVSFQPPDDVGIRPTPYTTDMAVNPSTYASVADAANISQPHGIGYVWATMLWEMYWNLVDRHGYNPNVYESWATGGNNLAIQLVMDGMKFQPCRPGFVDGRDAILTADVALTGGENQCEIWRAFAKRGLGYSADQGSSRNRFDGVEAFDLPPSCTSAHFGGFAPPVFGPPELNEVNAGSTVPLKFKLTGATYLVIDSQPVDCDTLVITGQAPSAVTMPGSTDLAQKTGEYRLNWQTDGAWAGTCRRLTLRIPAESDAVAFFRFH